ncbi:uncharacterized protein LOC124280481 [Haliotis rubra]|uniref:uncharacterized protein LOC124280481 n=1 Tax=Haliotis rubra TaxID=36100 RepID=UPI001EE5576B|nr:uncharacterized protein LOC124280481 [Haliotis rubra]
MAHMFSAGSRQVMSQAISGPIWPQYDFTVGAMLLLVCLSACVALAAGGGALDCPGGHRYSARGTAYYPADNPLEGGFVDMRGARLRTLQQFLAGSASYVSVAMDNHAGIAYGTSICIPEMNQRYNKHIVFKVVDTGSAFFGKGHSRIDICVSSQANSYDSTINGHLTLVFP